MKTAQIYHELTAYNVWMTASRYEAYAARTDAHGRRDPGAFLGSTYRTFSHSLFSNLWRALSHLFHHHTHHRGQRTMLLSRCGADPGGTDLMSPVLSRASGGESI